MTDQADRRIVRATLRRLEAERADRVPVPTGEARRAAQRRGFLTQGCSEAASVVVVCLGLPTSFVAAWIGIWAALHLGTWLWMVWRDARREGAFWP